MSLRRSLLTLSAAAALAAGCGSENGTSADRSGSGTPQAAADPGLQHIHGLGVSGDTLFIATHTGLWTAAEGQTTVRRFGASRQDIMGFSVLAEGRFLGSGHPGPDQADLPPNLGLIESPDGGRNWKSLSLLGEADFHVLESAGRHVYGVNSADGALMVSADAGRAWQKRTPPAAIFSIAIDPRAPQHILASTERGLFSSNNAGHSWRPLRDDLAGLLAWPTPQQLYLVDGDGAIQLSPDGGRTWRSTGNTGGQPAAFIAHGNDLYAALADGTVKRSTDRGRTWTLRAAP
jgi:photosystem II stability/assembly factor-like uncharacterized protein